MANSVRYVSEIAETEYPAWREILFGLPDTYAAWRWFFNRDLAEAGAGKNQVVPVMIQPGEYLAYCKAIRIVPDMRSFRDFGGVKSAGR